MKLYRSSETFKAFVQTITDNYLQKLNFSLKDFLIL